MLLKMSTSVKLARPSPIRPGRNDGCPCGSGRKFKRCCGAAGSAATETADAAITGARSRPEDAAAAAELAPGSPDARPSSQQRAPMADAGRAAIRHLERGAQRLEDGNVAAAVNTLRKAIRLDPSNALAHRDLGLALLRSGRLPEAIASFRQAITLRPDLATAFHHLAVALERLGQSREAIGAYQKAAELDPRDAIACSRVAELIMQHGGDRNVAAAWFRRAVVAAPLTPVGRLNHARVLVMEDKYEQAEQELRRLLTLAPRLSEAHYLLGGVLGFTGRFTEARESLERALQIDPTNYTAYLAMVADKKLDEADRPLVARMLAALKACPSAHEGRMFLHFALGKAFDDLKDYGEAMRQFDAANALRKRFIAINPEDVRRRVEMIIKGFTPEVFARHAEVATADETPVLIVGMPRSGTTLVEQILSSHPQIAGAGELTFLLQQEIPTTAQGSACISAGHARAIIDGYLSVLRAVSASAVRVTDKLPFNFTTAGLLHTLFPNARIVHCRRHPVDVCISIYATFFESQMSFAWSKEDLVLAYRQYERMMRHWRAVLPADRLFEVDYESLTAEPESHARRLIAFCGLEWDDACLRPQGNRRAVRTASYWQARQPIYRTSVERWRRYERWLGPLRELLEQSPGDA